MPATRVFRRDGNFWTVAWDDAVVRLKDTRGLQYLAQLLARPGQEIHVLDLVAAVHAEPGQAARRHLASADAGTVLDATARAAYRRRLADLRDELEEAAAYGDLGRTDRLRAEMEFLTEQLASAMGIGGAARRVGGPSERARSAVTQNIRSTLKRLVQALPGAGRAARTAHSHRRLLRVRAGSLPPGRLAALVGRSRRSLPCATLTARPRASSMTRGSVPDRPSCASYLACECGCRSSRW